MATIVVGNWKMRLGVRESVSLARAVARHVERLDPAPEVLVAPSLVALAPVAEAIKGTRIRAAAQTAASEPSGSYTGQVSAENVKEAGAHAVLLGHSEQRQYCGVTDHDVRRALECALEAHVRPILCFGEPQAIKEAGETVGYIREQLTILLQDLKMAPRTELWLAYEPLWAIGTGQAASVHDAVTVAKATAEVLEEHGIERAKFLYGGSVDASSVYTFLQHERIDGVLVGTKSTTLASFSDIIHRASETMN